MKEGRIEREGEKGGERLKLKGAAFPRKKVTGKVNSLEQRRKHKFDKYGGSKRDREEERKRGPLSGFS